MAKQETSPLPYRSTLEQEAQEARVRSARVTRRMFIAIGGVTASAGAILLLTGKGEQVLDLFSKEDKEPTNEQKEAYGHLVVERLDVIPDLVLVGEPGLPSKLRDKPYTEREYGKPVGEVVARVDKRVDAGDGFVVLGNDPFAQNDKGRTDPWIAILNPARDKSKVPGPTDIVFSHVGNFSLTEEQHLQILKIANRLRVSKSS